MSVSVILQKKDNMSELFKEWRENLKDEDIAILSEYTQFLYEEVNDFLREDILNKGFGESPDDIRLKDSVEKIDEILGRFSLPHDIYVYRNESYNFTLEEICDYLEGLDKIEYKNYISTSFTKEASDRFYFILKSHHPDENILRMEGKIEKEISCGYLDKEISKMLDQEDEILILRNISFYIKNKSIKIDSKNNFISVEGEYRKGIMP